MWVDDPGSARSLIGHSVIAIHPDALMHAVDELMAIGPSVKHLKVRAGEHLAALLLTAVCGRPLGVDTSGGVDLVFDEHSPESRNWPFGDRTRAAVEIKSFAGRFRHVESRMQIGDSHSVVVQTATEVLNDASGQITKAIAALERKTDTKTSKNVFLIIHPFEAMAVEAFSADAPVIGHRLPRLSSSTVVDTVWVLWHPEMFVVWSQQDRRWTDILFAVAHDPPHATPDDDLAPLQKAEYRFLAAIDYPHDSPWTFGVSLEGETDG